MVCSLPGSSVHGILQARILEWVAISFSRGSSQWSNPGHLHCRKILYHLSHQTLSFSTWILVYMPARKEYYRNYVSLLRCFSRVWLFAPLWTATCQVSQSMGFSRQEYWSGLPFPSPGHLPAPRIEPRSFALLADSLPSKPIGKPTKGNEGSGKGFSCFLQERL